METTNENMIKFEVIADYHNALYKKGEMIYTFKEGNAYALQNSEDVCLFDYPEIFKKL